KPGARKVAAAKPLRCGCLADGHLYAAAEDPPRIEKIEPVSGKVVQTYPLRAGLPASLAVFPARDRAYFPVDGVVHELNLRTGAVAKTDMPGQLVAGEPTQRFLYSSFKPERRARGGYILVGGRPVYFRREG